MGVCEERNQKKSDKMCSQSNLNDGRVVFGCTILSTFPQIRSREILKVGEKRSRVVPVLARRFRLTLSRVGLHCFFCKQQPW